MQYLVPTCFLLSKTSWAGTVQCGFRIIILLLMRLFTRCFRLFKNVTETKEYFEMSPHMHELCIFSPWKIWFYVLRYCLEMAPVLPVLQEWLWAAVGGLGVQGIYIRTILRRSYYRPSTWNIESDLNWEKTLNVCGKLQSSLASSELEWD